MGSVQYMARPDEDERAAAACDLLVLVKWYGTV